MTRQECNAKIRKEVEDLKQFRNDNSAFLIWFLINIYCLSEQDSIDAICDGKNDKGIDAIWFDEKNEEIYIFQSEFSPDDDKNAGDTKIREFAGIFNWFKSEENIKSLEHGFINEELKNKLETLLIAEKIARGCNVNFVYITNKLFDKNAKEFLSTIKIEAYDNNTIIQHYTYSSAPEIKNNPIKLNITNDSVLKYEDKSIVLSIPATELVKLEGIQDQSLFSRNVRLYTGNTRVNKDIVRTIMDKNEHELFFLYHNGISITCTKYIYENNELTLSGYQVINGCQSLMTLFQNQDIITDKIQILTKIILIDNIDSSLIKKITKNSNNQNAISLKDLRSNDRVQITLQNTFNEFYGSSIFYMIKRGEVASGSQKYITIDLAGQLIKAFYFYESYNTHLKTSFFGEEYESIFSKSMNCHKIYLAFIIFNIISENANLISNEPIKVYGLARYSLLSIIGKILEDDAIGICILNKPEDYLKFENINNLMKSITLLFKLIVLDYNAYIDDYISKHSFFDYKNLFKNKEFCTILFDSILLDHKKSIVRHSEDSFENIYNGSNH